MQRIRSLIRLLARRSRRPSQPLKRRTTVNGSPDASPCRGDEVDIAGRGREPEVMPKTRTILIWNVPVELHRSLKTRAAVEGLSLSEYVLHEISKAAEDPPRREHVGRLTGRASVRLEQSAADLIRAHRDLR
jgi:hypothetical protein